MEELTCAIEAQSINPSEKFSAVLDILRSPGLHINIDPPHRTSAVSTRTQKLHGTLSPLNKSAGTAKEAMAVVLAKVVFTSASVLTVIRVGFPPARVGRLLAEVYRSR